MNHEIIINNVPPQDITIIGEGAEVIGIVDVLVNGISVVTNNKAYVTVPTKTSELQNDSGFITSETDPTVPSYVKNINQADINSWNNKQNLLVSGVNIKTINENNILGSGNITINTSYTAGTGINIDENNEISNTITSYNDLSDLPTIPDKTSQLTNDSDYVKSTDLSDVAFSGSYADLLNLPTIPDKTSELVNDSEFAYTDQYNNFLADQDITGNLTVSGNIDYKKYKSTEHFIGYWIDNKLLYEKSFAVTLPNNTTGSVNTGFTTEQVKTIYGSYTDGIRVYPINFYDQTSHNRINTYYDNSYIKFETNFDGSGYTGYVTVEYTKN